MSIYIKYGMKIIDRETLEIKISAISKDVQAELDKGKKMPPQPKEISDWFKKNLASFKRDYEGRLNMIYKLDQSSPFFKTKALWENLTPKQIDILKNRIADTAATDPKEAFGTAWDEIEKISKVKGLD